MDGLGTGRPEDQESHKKEAICPCQANGPFVVKVTAYLDAGMAFLAKSACCLAWVKCSSATLAWVWAAVWSLAAMSLATSW